MIVSNKQVGDNDGERWLNLSIVERIRSLDDIDSMIALINDGRFDGLLARDMIPPLDVLVS